MTGFKLGLFGSIIFSLSFGALISCQSEEAFNDQATAEAEQVTMQEAKSDAEDGAVEPSNETIDQRMLRKFKVLKPNIQSIELEETPLKGIYWVKIDNESMALMSESGDFYLSGELYDISGGSPLKVLSEMQKKADIEKGELAANVFQNAPKEELVVFPAKGEKKGEVYVFTDVNCGYCRKFHKDVPALNEAGIEVNYYAGPFFSRDRSILEKIWCSTDKREAMTLAKAKRNLGDVTVTPACVDIVSKHMDLGSRLGVTGTPAVFAKSGVQLGGYVPPKELASMASSKPSTK